MATFSTIKKNISKLISTKPILINSIELDSIGSQINLVGIDSLQSVRLDQNKSFSPRLLNWIEPYVIGGFQKTLFYTEVNSGLNVGDKIFIANGNYDSNSIIKKDKYKKGTDGYKVLFIDRCKVVLDIDYTGILPYNDDGDNEFINIFKIEDHDDFLNLNRQITTRGGVFDYKFNKFQNNIIYSEIDFPAIQGWGANNGLTGSPGFFVKNGTQSWTNITPSFIVGSFSIALSATYSNNNRIKIHNKSFSYNNLDFKENFIYKWGATPEPDAIAGTTSNWIIDALYSKPILSKGNFRNGKFNGVWNTGLYGTQDSKINWIGDQSVWNGGTLLNSIWEKGTFDSKYSLDESYFSDFDSNGIPFQKLNSENNNGRGYNFIIDSEIKESTINNGSVINTTIGLTISSTTYSVVESHILSNSIPFNNIINKAFFEKCNFSNIYISNSEVKNSRSINTKFNAIKSINSHYKSSVIKDSNYISDDIIKIDGYDEFILRGNATNGPSHKVYKFYINKNGYDRLKLKDKFFIKGLKINNNDKSPLNFFDKRFKFSSWTEYVDFYSGNIIPQPNAVGILPNTFYKRGIEMASFISTPLDNDWSYSVITNGSSYYNGVISENSVKKYSVDVVISLFDKNNKIIEDIDFNRDRSLSGTSSLTLPNSLGNILDVTNAYILDSDFESGIFETSNWNSGHHINYNNDVNITKYTNEGGFYNILIATNSSSIFATTTFDPSYKETDDNCLSPGNIVFLNSIDYDTQGKANGMIISASGTSYSTVNGLSASGSITGQNILIDITADTIGTVLAITASLPNGSSYATASNVSTTGGMGSGLTVNITANGISQVNSIGISTPGVGYDIGDIITINGGSNATFSISSITRGEVLSATINDGGIGYQVGEYLTLNSGGFNSTVQIISTTGSLTRLPDSYKIVSNVTGLSSSTIEMSEIVTGTMSLISSLLDGGIFYTEKAENRYSYIHKSKITKSKIKSGLFKRSYITESLIEDETYDTSDKDFNNLQKIRNLLLSELIYSNTKNILSKATYINSSFTNGNDSFKNGIVLNSIWTGLTFSNGIFKQSKWNGGSFNRGVFYDNRTYDGISSLYHQNHKSNKVKSFYKSGKTTGTVSNNRYAWISGDFNQGEFYKSNWEDGNFINGKFYYSNFFTGSFNGGVMGSSEISVSNTQFYNGTINYATVDNATIYSQDMSYTGLFPSNITWNNGVFNSGIFGSNDDQLLTNNIVWNDGIFNGGQFISSAKWKNGIFNGGKFLSSYGWTMSNSLINTDYTWEKGIFNGGEFGQLNGLTNSTWYTGEFNGGIFKGRVWNNGIFIGGELQGSSTYSSVGGFESSNASLFVDSFSQSYYGLWRNGIVSNSKDKFIKDKKIYTDIIRAKNQPKKNLAILKNTIWQAGTFSHPNGELFNSVWLDGVFENGSFKNSSFNPYVKRNGSSQSSFNINDNTCYWENGSFTGGDFHISKWENGKFIIGTGIGMIWKNGVSNYMNAYNIFWENGIWRNGNWYGSDFDYTGSIDGYTKGIIERGISWSGTQSFHMWNIFKTTDNSNINIVEATASTPTITS